MIPRPFEYFAPTTVKEATALLKRFGPEGRILAGGMSLIPAMKLRSQSPSKVIDINRIRGLDSIKMSGDSLSIGALARHGDVQHSSVVREKAYLLSETVSMIGDPQIRNMGTIGGALAYCDPSGDLGAALLALRCEVATAGPASQRRVSIDDFFVDGFKSALRPGEMVTEILVPVPPAKSGGAYMKLERSLADYPTVGVAVQISLDKEDVCIRAGIGLAALGPKSLRAATAERTLVGSAFTAKTIKEAAAAAAEDARPTSDPLRGSAEYKKEMAEVYARRGLEAAMRRAKGIRR